MSKEMDENLVVADNSEGNNWITIDYNKDIVTAQLLPKVSLCVKPSLRRGSIFDRPKAASLGRAEGLERTCLTAST